MKKLIVLLTVATVFSLTDTSIYKMEFLDPVDTSFISADSLHVNVSLLNQAGQAADSFDGFLTVRALSGTGSGGSNTLVNQQPLTDNGDGTYSYKGIYIGDLTASSFEMRVRFNGEGSQRIEDRRVIKHDTIPGSATSAWKVSILNLTPVLNGDSEIVVIAKLTNAAGTALSDQSISLAVLDNSNQAIEGLGGSMVSLGDGIYSDTITSDVLINGADYVFSVSTTSQPLVYSQVCSEISKVVILPPVLIALVPNVTTNLRPTLRWYSVDDASSYTIQIDTTARFASPMMTVPLSDTFYAPPVNLPVKTIYWRVSSSLLPLLYSAASSFTIQSDTIPVIVRFYGDTLIERRPEFTWHPVAHATAYTLQISHTRNFSTIQISTPLTDTFYSPLINLDTANRYFWRVSCDLNNSVYSSADSFIIIIRSTSTELVQKSITPALLVLPNPFTNVLSVNLSGVQNGLTVVFNVFDISGRKVATLDGAYQGRSYSAIWNKNKSSGTGIYFVRTEVGGRVFESRVLSIR